MSALMDPSTTMKFLLPLVFAPVTVFTSAAALATMERPCRAHQAALCQGRQLSGAMLSLK